MSRLAIACLVLTFLLGCATEGAVNKPFFKPMSVGAADEVYRVCGTTLGVSCSMNPALNRLTVTIDQTGTPEETQRGVAFVATYYCRLSRIEGNDENTVLLVRPDGSQVGRPCSLIGTVDQE
jgi:hypothetical protein